MKRIFIITILLGFGISAISQTSYDIDGDYKISGKLGIGTTTLNSKVNINGEIFNFSEVGSLQFKLKPLNNNTESYFTALSGDESSWARFGHSPKNTTNAMFFNTSASKYWFLSKPIHIEGNVGIGTSNISNYRLNVNGTILNYSETGSIQFKLKPKDNSSESYFTALSGDESSWARFGHSPKNTTNAMFFNTSADKYWFVSKLVHIDGNVGVGTSDTKGYKLAVAGKVVAEEVVVALQADWADFVFNKDYKLKNLEEVENFIEENNHLPDIPSEKEVKENGVQVGEMNAKLLQKIEELTLYMIEMNKEVKALKNENELLKEEINTLKTQ